MMPTDGLIDPNRFRRLFHEMAQVGATGDGGVHRVAASAGDRAARDMLRRWFDALGLRTVIDPVGNMAGLLNLAGPGAPVVFAGSHLDSQPYGGRFDGAAGVVAACEAAHALSAAAKDGTLSPGCNLAVVNWTAEEGARFQPSLLGSSVFNGTMALDDALARRDQAGTTLGEALQTMGYAGVGALPCPAAYLELHIECASVLHDAGERLGVFTHHWGAVKQRIAFVGEQAHTGPTPMALRRDALLGAAYLIAALRELSDQADGILHTSAGRIDVSPNSPNVVAAEAVLFAELRSTDPALLTWAETELRRRAERAAAQAGVKLDWRGTERRPAGRFDGVLTALCAKEASALGIAARTLSTVPGHDAVSLVRVCPSAMLVVPSVGGVCHNAGEFTDMDDLLLGTEALTRVLWRLCEQGGVR